MATLAELEARIIKLEKKVTKERLDTAGINFDENGAIPAAYQGAVTFISLKDFPNLVKRVGNGATLDKAKKVFNFMTLQCSSFANADGTGFAGYRFARVTGAPGGTTVADIVWPVVVTKDAAGNNIDTDATFKCITVSAFKFKEDAVVVTP